MGLCTATLCAGMGANSRQVEHAVCLAVCIHGESTNEHPARCDSLVVLAGASASESLAVMASHLSSRQDDVGQGKRDMGYGTGQEQTL